MQLTRGQIETGNWLRVVDYAARFHLPTETIFTWAREGSIPFGTFEGRVMIPAVCGRRDRWRGRR